MADNDLKTCLEESKIMAEDLLRRLLDYRKAALEPDSTQSIPSLSYICQLSEDLVKKLECQQ